MLEGEGGRQQGLAQKRSAANFACPPPATTSIRVVWVAMRGWARMVGVVGQGACPTLPAPLPNPKPPPAFMPLPQVFGEVSLDPQHLVQYDYSARVREDVVVVALTDEACLQGMLQQLGNRPEGYESGAFAQVRLRDACMHTCACLHVCVHACVCACVRVQGVGVCVRAPHERCVPSVLQQLGSGGEGGELGSSA